MYDDMVSEAPGSRNAFGHNIVNICIQNGYYDPESISIRGIYKKCNHVSLEEQNLLFVDFH
ncbi:hypothetical protein RirG_101980 [Rhizophagus irregularis DAOM 197198w]|uniref:Uncharacterized protein n=1 Tax=Rhizophagus irregularis (strain DAOM 197198w) TaxID=1432141 RepID=A0A015KMP4_RHIIW|nr:hypothetical protein RirG_101980 [Rhizophagus irregularis DAOM 197198w]